MTVRLAHLSDIHFGGENAAAVAGATAHVNDGQFDLVVVTGDLTRFAELDEFDRAAAWLKEIRAPKLVTPGNHDAPYLAWGERVFTPFRRYEHAIGPAPAQVYRGGGFSVRGLNTARGAQPRINWSKGQISKRQVNAAVDWFEDCHPTCVRIVACHHPLTEMIGGPMTGRVWGGEAAAAATSPKPASIWCSPGTSTRPSYWPYAFADGRTYAVGAGTLSIRERGVAPSFNVIEIDEAAIRVAAMGWTGSHFEPLRTTSLDRRQDGPSGA